MKGLKTCAQGAEKRRARGQLCPRHGMSLRSLLGVWLLTLEREVQGVLDLKWSQGACVLLCKGRTPTRISTCKSREKHRGHNYGLKKTTMCRSQAHSWTSCPGGTAIRMADRPKRAFATRCEDDARKKSRSWAVDKNTPLPSKNPEGSWKLTNEL